MALLISAPLSGCRKRDELPIHGEAEAEQVGGIVSDVVWGLEGSETELTERVKKDPRVIEALEQTSYVDAKDIEIFKDDLGGIIVIVYYYSGVGMVMVQQANQSADPKVTRWEKRGE